MARAPSARAAWACLRRSRSRSTTNRRCASFSLSEGDRLGFALRWAPAEQKEPPAPAAADHVFDRIDDTAAAWRSWEAHHDIYEGQNKELVRLSSRVLKGPTYRPTGAIVAAPTTSLPETVGGERNWDYRFSWIRDSSLTIEALYIGACSDEAEEFVSFMTSSAGGRQARARSRSCTGSAANTISPSASCRTCAAGATRARARGERGLGPGAAGRLWRAPELTVALQGKAGRATPGDTAVRRRPRRHGGPALDGDRLRDVGDARRAAAPPVVQGPLLGRP